LERGLKEEKFIKQKQKQKMGARAPKTRIERRQQPALERQKVVIERPRFQISSVTDLRVLF
jgi:hypothetical protein